jgi:hypothetical protein
MLKKIIVFGIVLLAVQFIACKKTPVYYISQEMKDYFFYKPGSYWIYRDNYSGLTDSVYVTSCKEYMQDYSDYGSKTASNEVQYIYFQSKFLYAFMMAGMMCNTANFMWVHTLEDTATPPGLVEDLNKPLVAYCPSYPANQSITLNCFNGETFKYRTAVSDTIDGVVYHNLIYSEHKRNYTTQTLSYYFQRNITFAKDVGIVKLIEVISDYNINRSYSLLRYKVVR